ncbi:MAG TPA: hypothetical protein VMU51_38720 [Mycobacteriales bacterium]|nr:hypothetical protein [Mycobacteriales bacterium]
MPTAAVSRGRPDLASRAVLSVLFTGVQVWAITVAVLHVPVGGAERVALAAALAAAVITVLDAWHELWTRSRRLLGRQHLVWAAATDGTPPGPR